MNIVEITTTAAPTLYSVLGVSPDADLKLIKHAHRCLVLKHHPDKQHCSGNNNNHDEFQRVQHAYQILSNPQLRTAYNQELSIQQSKKQSSGVVIVVNKSELQMEWVEIVKDDNSTDCSTCQIYIYNCRCGGTIELFKQDFSASNACSNCSLAIRVDST